MFHGSVVGRQGWEHWVVGRFFGCGDEQVVASSGSTLYLYSVIESPLTGLRRFICEARQELFSLVLSLKTFELVTETGSETLLLVLDDGGRLSAYRLCASTGIDVARFRFCCLLTHRISRSNIRNNTPWKLCTGFGYVVVLLLDATLLVFRLVSKESSNDMDSTLSDALDQDSLFLLAPEQYDLVTFIDSISNSVRNTVHNHTKGWGVPALVGLDVSIELLSDLYCFALVKDTRTGLNLIFRINTTNKHSKTCYLLVSPSIHHLRRVSFGLLGFGRQSVLLLRTDMLQASWLSLYPFATVLHDGGTAFDYAEHGDLLIDLESPSIYGMLDPLRLIATSLFGTYLSITFNSTNTEDIGGKSVSSNLVFAQEMQYDNDHSHIWLLDEMGELVSVLVSLTQSLEPSLSSDNVLFVSHSDDLKRQTSTVADLQSNERYYLHFIEPLSFHIMHVGSLSSHSFGAFFLEKGFFCCVTDLGGPVMYRLIGLPSGHKQVILPAVGSTLECPTYKDGRAVYPAMFLLHYLVNPLQLDFVASEHALEQILLYECLFPVIEPITAALVLSKHLRADSRYIIADKTSLSLCSLAISTVRIFSGPLLSEKECSAVSAEMQQITLGSASYLVISYISGTPRQHKNVCMKVVETGLELAVHSSAVLTSLTDYITLSADICTVKLLYVAEHAISEQLTTPIYLEGQSFGLFFVTTETILQVICPYVEKPHIFRFVFITVCGNSARNMIDFSVPTLEGTNEEASESEFSMEDWRGLHAKKRRQLDDISDDETGVVLHPQSHLLFVYECTLREDDNLETVLYAICNTSRYLYVCLHTTYTLLKFRFTLEQLQHLQTWGEATTRAASIVSFAPRVTLELHRPLRHETVGRLSHLYDHLHLRFHESTLDIYSELSAPANVEAKQENQIVTDSKEHTCAGNILAVFQTVLDASINEFQYMPLFLHTTKGLQLLYFNRSNESFVDMKMMISLLGLSNHLEYTATIFIEPVQLSFGKQGQESRDMRRCIVCPLSNTSVVIAGEGLVAYLLTFFIIEGCPIPDRLCQLDFSIPLPLFVSPLTFEGTLNGYLMVLGTDLQFHIYEPILGIPCPTLRRSHVILESPTGLSITSLTMLKGGYCSCIAQQGAGNDQAYFLVLSRVINLGNASGENEIGIKQKLPLTTKSRALSYDYPSGTLSWAEGSTIFTVGKIVKLASQSSQTIHPSQYPIPSERTITAICILHQTPNIMCIGVDRRILIFDTVTAEVVAQETLADVVTRLISPNSTRIVAVLQKAGLVILSYRDRNLTTYLTDCVPLRVVTAIVQLDQDIFVIGDRFGTVSVFSCAGDNKYRYISVDRKLHLYAEICLWSPVISLTVEPRQNMGKPPDLLANAHYIVHYILLTGEIGYIALTADKGTFSRLLCMQEQAHLKGLYNPTKCLTNEAHRRFRYGMYSFVNSIDIPFLTDVYRADLLSPLPAVDSLNPTKSH